MQSIKRTKIKIAKIMLITSLVLLILLASCKQSSQPEPTFKNPCSQINALTCRTTSTTSGIMCCMNMFNQNAATGYACILGRNQLGGCYNSLEQARKLGCKGTVIRCVRE